MNNISSFILTTVPKTNIRSKRAYIISQFLEELNRDNPKPYKAAYISFRLSHCKIPDMEYLFSVCKSYEKEGKGPFAKMFFGQLKIRNANN